MNFSEALECIKAGNFVRRESWKGSQFLHYRECDNVVVCETDTHASPFIAASSDILADDWAVFIKYEYEYCDTYNFHRAVTMCIDNPGKCAIKYGDSKLEIAQIYDKDTNTFKVIRIDGFPCDVDSGAFRMPINSIISNAKQFDIYVRSDD